jgi:hypothetical protein
LGFLLVLPVSDTYAQDVPIELTDGSTIKIEITRVLDAIGKLRANNVQYDKILKNTDGTIGIVKPTMEYNGKRYRFVNNPDYSDPTGVCRLFGFRDAVFATKDSGGVFDLAEDLIGVNADGQVRYLDWRQRFHVESINCK